MSDKAAEIREHIKRIASVGTSGFVVFQAEVTVVTDQDCSVKLGDMELTKVRLFSQATAAGNILLQPKVGSMATILSDAQLRDMELIKSDSITSFKFTENDLVIEFDSESKKVDIKNADTGLKVLMQAVADIIKQLTVSTPAGPSGTPLPPTVQAVTQFETDFKKLLK